MTNPDRILDTIGSPADLKTLTRAQLDQLAAEIREQLVSTISVTGGHLAPNLGVVELVLGLYRALDMPEDIVSYDVGHQSYVHKILTGRCDRFDTLRCYEGISGFPKRDESPFDLFGSGHASDSISIALGYALARDARGGDETVVAFIGDGSMTGGMAFEALNHVGHLQSKMIIILNDNEMSIARNVGALSSYLGRMRLNKRYWGLREKVQHTLEPSPIGYRFVQAGKALRDSVKQLVVPGMLFEEFGVNYVGPIDGHDVEQVEMAVLAAKGYDGPVLIHAVTEKGRGYEFAACQPDVFHGTGPFDRELGCAPAPSTPKPPSYTDVFAKALIAEAGRDERIHAITAAMPNGTGLDKFEERFPDRFYDVGIAEQHAVGLAAGLAFGGLVPVVAIYSTFLQRAYDQVMGDVALQGAHVVFALDRGGFVGEDGPTHHGLFDLTYLRTIPTMKILAPSNEAELVDALHTAIELDGPVALRYPRGGGDGVALPDEPTSWEVGRSVTLAAGTDVAIVAVGRMVGVATKAAAILAGSGISATVVNGRWVKPVDDRRIAELANSHRLLISLEENTIRGGFGAAVLESLSAAGIAVPTLTVAAPDEFAKHGPMAQLLDDAGLSPERVAVAVRTRLAEIDAASGRA